VLPPGQSLSAYAVGLSAYAVERERESLFATKYKKTYKIIVNITIVAGYQIGKPIKLVAYSTNYINS